VFRSQRPHLAEKLTITIQAMELLSPDTLNEVMDWLDRLPYPWCSRQDARERMPRLDELGPIHRGLSSDRD